MACKGPPQLFVHELDPICLSVIRGISGKIALLYIRDTVLPGIQAAARAESADVDSIKDALADPYKCLRCFFGYYAFARRGKDKDELSRLAVQSLRDLSKSSDFEEILQRDDGVKIWEHFCRHCAEVKRKPAEQLNRGILQGMVELAQEIYRLDGVGSIVNWVVQGVIQTERIEPQFERIVDVRGVGPKITSLFLRDIVFLYNLEDRIDGVDRLYFLPIDKWGRLFSRYVVPEPQIEEAVDWVIAGKMSKWVRRAGCSPVLFNIGATQFGLKEIRTPERFEEVIRESFY